LHDGAAIIAAEEVVSSARILFLGVGNGTQCQRQPLSHLLGNRQHLGLDRLGFREPWLTSGLSPNAAPSAECAGQACPFGARAGAMVSGVSKVDCIAVGERALCTA